MNNWNTFFSSLAQITERSIQACIYTDPHSLQENRKKKYKNGIYDLSYQPTWPNGDVPKASLFRGFVGLDSKLTSKVT